VRVRVDDDPGARLDREADVLVAQVEPVGEPLISSATPVSSATAIVSSRSSAFGGRRPIRRPVGWLSARTAGWRMDVATRRVSSGPGARWPA